MRSVMLSGLALVAFSSSVLAADLGSTIRENNEAFAEAFNRGDAAGVAALYTEDAVILPPGAPMAKGREAIAAFWKGGMDAGMRDLKLETVDLEDYGEAAREIGRFSGKAGENRIAGTYVVVWKKGGDGRWRLATDIWHTDGN